MKRKFLCEHTAQRSDNRDILKIKVSKKGKLIISIGEEKHTNREKVKITKEQAQEISAGMDDVLVNNRCNVVQVDDNKSIDVDTVLCFAGTHYCFGIDTEVDFESVHLIKGDFDKLCTQIRHFSIEGELV